MVLMVLAAGCYTAANTRQPQPVRKSSRCPVLRGVRGSARSARGELVRKRDPFAADTLAGSCAEESVCLDAR
jgi:hypothetical protein